MEQILTGEVGSCLPLLSQCYLQLLQQNIFFGCQTVDAGGGGGGSSGIRAEEAAGGQRPEPGAENKAAEQRFEQ